MRILVMQRLWVYFGAVHHIPKYSNQGLLCLLPLRLIGGVNEFQL